MKGLRLPKIATAFCAVLLLAGCASTPQLDTVSGISSSTNGCIDRVYAHQRSINGERRWLDDYAMGYAARYCTQVAQSASSQTVLGVAVAE